jgi:signal transduction histidine kinase
VRAATQRMKELIDDLLNLSRVARAEMSLTKMDLSVVARSIIAELERTQPGRQVKCVIEDGLEAAADSHLLIKGIERFLPVDHDGLAWQAWSSTRPFITSIFAWSSRRSANVLLSLRRM